MSSFTPLDEVISRKRKQEPSTLSDYVYSSPNSPSHSMNLPSTDVMENGYSLGGGNCSYDLILNSFEYPAVNDFQQQPFMHHASDLLSNEYNSRYHSNAAGDLEYHHHHTFEQQANSHSLGSGMDWGSSDFQRLLDGDGELSGKTSLPSSFSSYSSGTTFNSMDALDHPPAAHQRTLSLRLENISYHDHAASASPTTPVFFSPSFLDSLSSSTEEDRNSLANHSFVDTISTASTPANTMGLQDHHNQNLPSDFMVHPEQLAIMTTPTQQQPSGMWASLGSCTPNAAKSSSISKRRQSTKNKSSPPSSPATTMSTCSPSPPITPSQYANGFESFHHTHPSIPEEEDEFTATTTKAKAKAKVTKAKKSTSTVTTRKATNGMDGNDDDVGHGGIQTQYMEAVPERHSKTSLIPARMLQGTHSASQLKPLIQHYLLSDNPSACGEHSITLLTSKVAQKSYGTEKRFLCPPPTTILSGASWWTSNVGGQDDMSVTKFYRSTSSGTDDGGDGSLCAPKLTIQISGELTSQNGALEWYQANGSLLDGASLAAAVKASSQGQATITGKCVSKQLHINDADEKRRRVEVMAKIQLGNGFHLGALASKGIKVISKPSKKRQSVKNMELCIHHGTTVSLFNRIRSQTVSTKYLGVSNGASSSGNDSTGACFVARTNSWDPFVIWIVDTSRSPELASSTQPTMQHHPLHPDFPPPPAIALQSGTSLQNPIALHYNQPVVLQCVSTGLVSPVMVIRKVDKGSTVFGGNRVEDLSGMTGGECGDEALGDPVSQLHKIAFQIVQDPSVAYHNKANYYPHPPMTPISSDWNLPRTSHTVSYLACLNDVVGMHKTTTPRTLVSTRPTPPISPATSASATQFSPWAASTLYDNVNDASSIVSSEIEPAGKVVRKRRVSCDVVVKPGSDSKFAVNGVNFGKASSSSGQRRRVNSLNDVPTRTATADGLGRRGSLADRRASISSDNGNPVDGNCWTEDVSDAAVFTIVGTESLTYTFWTPPLSAAQDDDSITTIPTWNSPFADPQSNHPITPFPLIDHINISTASSSTMLISGENLTRDLTVWFGDIKAPFSKYKSKDLLSCSIPDESELASSLVMAATATSADDDTLLTRKLPILLVRGDGVVYRTGRFYTF